MKLIHKIIKLDFFLTIFSVGNSFIAKDCIIICSRFENVVTYPLSKNAILPALPEICLNKETETIDNLKERKQKVNQKKIQNYFLNRCFIFFQRIKYNSLLKRN